MLEPYEWKRSCMVLRRESGSNPANLVDYRILFQETTKAITALQKAQQLAEELYIAYDITDNLIVIGKEADDISEEEKHPLQD
ncbi:Hypothetical protein DPCES_1893 [Desulfitobacterium hafniense]|uniref:Uncharacterized protein n=3 Tax=root TaxID=1 RepID=A0A098B0A1_DESHA|nr:hypothetical protein [Desulfitobacterium hafniense]CDX01780.1 Hypothetical protein DPCES_1893 [Desulfitobacterium hafniense]